MKTAIFSKFIVVITSVLLIMAFAMYYSACSDESSCAEDGERCNSNSDCCDGYCDDPITPGIYICI